MGSALTLAMRDLPFLDGIEPTRFVNDGIRDHNRPIIGFPVVILKSFRPSVD
jgi:hypothetical protein